MFDVDAKFKLPHLLHVQQFDHVSFLLAGCTTFPFLFILKNESLGVFLCRIK